MKGELDPKLLRKIHKKTSKAVSIQSHAIEPNIISLASLAKDDFKDVKTEDFGSGQNLARKRAMKL